MWLTEHARELRGPAVEAATAENAAALASLSERERRLFVELMRRIIAARSGNDDRRKE